MFLSFLASVSIARVGGCFAADSETKISPALAGALIGFVPAIKAYRNALVDGLAIRV